MKRRKHLLLWTSLGTLVLLGWAIYEEHFSQEWRLLQDQYRMRLEPAAARSFAVQLRQIVVPALNTTDRCVSCHVGMAAGETPIEGHPVFGSHPPVAHDPSEFGCTVCHGGQGRATRIADAHGTAPFWPQPMLPRGFAYAGCGSCHTHLAVTNLDQLERGRSLVERFDCLRCHELEGRGGTTRPFQATGPPAPDLSAVGARGFSPGWHDQHLERSRDAADGYWKDSITVLDVGQRRDLETFLRSRAGAPGLVESKALFHSQGCRGCHKVNAVGGDDGPDLSLAGQKDPALLDFSGLPGERSLPEWLREHFRAPAKVVAGSQMPYLGLDDEQIEGLTFYMLSLRRTSFPEAYWPPDRVRAQLLGERDFSADGATLYGTFCAACHGPRGQGMRYPGTSAFPAVANPDFLELASDEFLLTAIRRGRPGRRMPAWGETEGGLTETEILTLASYLRRLGGREPEPDGQPARWVRAEAESGGALYAQNCASCHGVEGQGGEGTALRNPVLLESASDTYLTETIWRGRRGTTMPAFSEASTIHRSLTRPEIESIVAFIRSWETRP